MANERSGVEGGNAKIPDSDIQGTKAGERMRRETNERDEADPDREGRPSEFPASKAGMDDRNA